jgi:hypothetical protein
MMPGLPVGTRVWFAGVAEMHAGFNSLAAMAQTALERDPLVGTSMPTCLCSGANAGVS